MTARTLRTGWTGTFFGWLVLGAALAWSATAQAQPYGNGPAGPTVPRNFTNKLSFTLPIQIDPRFLPATREVILYGRTPHSPWEKILSVPPGTPHFPCRVVEDGEYWYSVVTVNSSGKATPEDVAKEPPAVIVIVDTTPPNVQVKPIVLQGGEMALECTLQDGNADYKMLQLQFRGPDQGWHNLTLVPGFPNVFRVPGPEVLNQPFRCTAVDLAKNVAAVEITLPRMQMQQPVDYQLTQQAKPNPAPAPFQAPSGFSAPTGTGEPQTSFRTNLPKIPDPVVTVSNSFNSSANPQPVPLNKIVEKPFNPVPLSPTGNAPIKGNSQFAQPLPSGNEPTETAAPVANKLPVALPQVPNPVTNVPMQNPVTSAPNPVNNVPNPMTSAPNPAPSAPVNQPANTQPAQPVYSQTGNGSRQLIATRLAQVQYRIDQVGPSGVSKVDIWVKGGQENGYQRMATDIDRRTPAEVMLPGDGLYGIRLAVTNGNGFGGQPPLPGDVPDFWVEVDTTAPVVQIQSVDPTSNSGTIDIRWTASDKNLVGEPIQLSYAVRAEGPWLPIAPRLKNEGHFSWQFPREAGGQFYIRAEVTDEAGNVARAQPPAPIQLDLTEPRAVVVGVNGVTQQPQAAPQNQN